MARMRVSVEELLLRHRAIDEDQLRKARAMQEKTGGDLGRVLVELGFVKEDLLLRTQAHQLGIPMVNLAKEAPPRELAAALTESLCRRFHVIPISGSLENKLLRVATSTPADLESLARLSQESGFRIVTAVATAASIESAIQQAFAPLPANGAEPLPPEIQPEPEVPTLLGDRVARLEKLLAEGQFAAVLARIERLEQVSERDHQALNVLGQILIELGFISREDLLKRLGRS